MKKTSNWKITLVLLGMFFLGYGLSVHAETTISRDLGFSETTQKKVNITGTVKSESGQAIIGALVADKNSSSDATITNAEGAFALTVAENANLEISYLGFKTQEVAVGSKSVINVVLEESTLEIDEIVVVGYGVQKKSSMVGAVSVIDAADIADIPNNSLSQSLAGRASGINVTGNSGMAGASSTIYFRGSTSDPLYVINNVISSKSQFDALDPNEVENISFLKDAATASIYGSKAGNGVVLVTTKSGSIGKPVFSYKGSYSASTAIDMQKYTATDELEWANKVQTYLGNDPVYDDASFAYFADKNYDINDYIWQNPFSFQNNLSVNGGTEQIQYYMMIGHQKQEGSYQNLEYERFNFRADVTARISNRVKVNLNLGGNQRDYDRFYWPYDSFDSFTVPDLYRATFNWTKLYPFYVDDAGNPTTDQNANPVIPSAWHPVELVNGDGYQRNTIRTFNGQISIDVDLEDITKGLTTKVMAQYEAGDSKYKAFILQNVSYLFQSASADAPYIPGPIDPNQKVVHNLSSSYDQIVNSMTTTGSYQFNWFLNYERAFGKHAVNGMLVYEQGNYNDYYMWGNAQDLLTTSIDQIYVASTDTSYRYFTGSENQTASQSLIGRFNYNYNEKYIAEFSFRYDGNYKFAPSYNWGFFPSASVAWRISQEKFMDEVDWLSNLKLRASYGTSGSDDGVSAFQWSDAFTTGSSYLFSDGLSQGIQEGSISNPYISWSKFENYNLGIDFGLLGNKLHGEVEIFKRKQSDILGSRTASVPGTFGASMPSENYAAREWKGYEFSLGWTDNIGDFSLSANVNFGYAIDKWLIYDEAEGLESWRSIIGQPSSRVFGYICEGIIRSEADLDALPEGFTQFGETPKLGTLLYRDIRGSNYSEGADGNIDSNDMTYLSDNGSPRINYGINLGAKWRGLSIDVLLQGVGAYDRMATTNNGSGVFQVNDKPYFDIWTGDTWTTENQDAEFPAASGIWSATSGFASSTYWMKSGAYMRLKNLNIGYTLPKKWYNKAGIGDIQLYINGTNLFCFSAFDLYDPEQSTIDSYPLMRTYTGGVSINF